MVVEKGFMATTLVRRAGFDASKPQERYRAQVYQKRIGKQTLQALSRLPVEGLLLQGTEESEFPYQTSNHPVGFTSCSDAVAFAGQLRSPRGRRRHRLPTFSASGGTGGSFLHPAGGLVK